MVKTLSPIYLSIYSSSHPSIHPSVFSGFFIGGGVIQDLFLKYCFCFQVREEIEFENLAKIYLREMIKRECWDEMDVKGRALQVSLITQHN